METSISKSKKQIKKLKKIQESLRDYSVPATSVYNGLVFQEAADMLNKVIEHLENIE